MQTMQSYRTLGYLTTGGRKGIRPVKTEWSGAGVVVLNEVQTCMCPSRCHCLQTGFTFLVLALPGNHGQRAIKRVCVSVCVVTQKIKRIFISAKNEQKYH